jgi:rubredoxin
MQMSRRLGDASRKPRRVLSSLVVYLLSTAATRKLRAPNPNPSRMTCQHCRPGGNAEYRRPRQALLPLPVATSHVSHQKFMCGGCYFIYEPSVGVPEQSMPSGTPFATISPSWRCPDCGTDPNDPSVLR